MCWCRWCSRRRWRGWRCCWAACWACSPPAPSSPSPRVSSAPRARPTAPGGSAPASRRVSGAHVTRGIATPAPAPGATWNRLPHADSGHTSSASLSPPCPGLVSQSLPSLCHVSRVSSPHPHVSSSRATVLHSPTLPHSLSDHLGKL